MSRGNDGRNDREGKESQRGDRKSAEPRSSRSSVRMTADRARAIQAQADRKGDNQDFKARAMAAAARNEARDPKDDKEPK